MIGWLEGQVRDKRPPYLLLQVGGVGYELQAPMSTFSGLPAAGTAVALHIHHLVREDAQQLFAFLSRRERDVFRQLLKVNGVGAKLALAILSGMDGDSLARCVNEGDTVSLSRLPGIGKKTAERLVIEMRDRLAGLDAAPGALAAAPGAPGAPPADAQAEAVSALVSLGLKPQEASRRVHAIEASGLACEDIVRMALQQMVR